MIKFATRQKMIAGDVAGLRLHLSRGLCIERGMGELSDEDRERVAAQLGEDAAASRLVRFVISTEERASDGHVIFHDAWDTADYRANPIVLFQHNRWSPRIAESVVFTEGKELRGIASFYPREVSELSYSLGEIAARGGHAASVGFDIVEAEVASEEVRKVTPWALDITNARLREWSLVNFGADPGALAEAREDGVDVSPIARAAGKLIDELGADEVLERLYLISRERRTTVDMTPAAAAAIEKRGSCPTCEQPVSATVAETEPAQDREVKPSLADDLSAVDWSQALKGAISQL